MTLDDPLPRRSRPPADPDLTGGRRSASCCSHGFTGSPASMRPWGRAPRRAGVRRGGAAAARPRHPWQEMNTGHLGRLVRRGSSRRFDGAARPRDAVVVGGLSMGGALVLRLAADRPDRRRRRSCWSTRSCTSARKDVKLLPVLKRVVPSFPGDRERHQEARVGRARLRPTPLKGCHSMIAGCGRRSSPDLAQGHRAAALFRSTESTTSSTRRRSPTHRGSRRATSTSERCSRTATTSRPSTTTPRGSSRSPPRSSPASRATTSGSTCRATSRPRARSVRRRPPRTPPGARSSRTTASRPEIDDRAGAEPAARRRAPPERPRRRRSRRRPDVTADEPTASCRRRRRRSRCSSRPPAAPGSASSASRRCCSCRWRWGSTCRRGSATCSSPGSSAASSTSWSPMSRGARDPWRRRRGGLTAPA